MAAEATLLDALRAVPGVAAADLESDDRPEGAGTLRLQLAPGADEIAVATSVNRVLREQFGLAVDAGRVQVVEESVPLAPPAAPSTEPAAAVAAEPVLAAAPEPKPALPPRPTLTAVPPYPETVLETDDMPAASTTVSAPAVEDVDETITPQLIESTRRRGS